VIEEHETGSDEEAQRTIDVGLAVPPVALLPAAPVKFFSWQSRKARPLLLASVLVLTVVGYFIYSARVARPRVATGHAHWRFSLSAI